MRVLLRLLLMIVLVITSTGRSGICRRGVAKLPTFRWDERMLKRGERSKNFHILPPGPNSPVGVVWIALNKRGIGIHGTDDPDTIGQAVSHGCIRLANWDVVRLAAKVKAGVQVSVH